MGLFRISSRTTLCFTPKMGISYSLVLFLEKNLPMGTMGAPRDPWGSPHFPPMLYDFYTAYIQVEECQLFGKIKKWSESDLYGSVWADTYSTRIDPGLGCLWDVSRKPHRKSKYAGTPGNRGKSWKINYFPYSPFVG